MFLTLRAYREWKFHCLIAIAVSSPALTEVHVQLCRHYELCNVLTHDRLDELRSVDKCVAVNVFLLLVFCDNRKTLQRPRVFCDVAFDCKVKKQFRAGQKGHTHQFSNLHFSSQPPHI